MTENELSGQFVDAAIEVHRGLGGPGLLDLVMGGKVLVKCKSSIQHSKGFESQVLTYLRLTGLKLGLLINFGEPRVIDGIRRVVNGLWQQHPIL